MYHSITFGNKNTWDDWRLIPSSRPLFAPPEVKVASLDIPGTSSTLDMTELYGRILYGNRKGSFNFIVENDFRSWEVAYSDIMGYLHGKRMTAVLEDDPGFYYEGRFKVNQWNSGKDWSTIAIDYDVDPYKYHVGYEDEELLWSPYNPDGFAKNFMLLPVEETMEVSIVGRRLQIPPKLIVNHSMTVTYNETEHTLNEGTNVIQALILEPSAENTLTFTGNGVVSIDYRGGVL